MKILKKNTDLICKSLKKKLKSKSNPFKGGSVIYFNRLKYIYIYLLIIIIINNNNMLK